MTIESTLLLLGISLTVFLIDAAMLYVATHALKYKETSFHKAVIATGTQWIASLAITIIAVLASFYLNLGNASNLTIISTISLILSLAAFIYIIKHFYKEDWNTTALSFIAVVIGQVALGILLSFVLMAPFIFWQMGVLNMEGDGKQFTPTTADGWVNIQVINDSTAYNANGLFETSLQNKVGTTMQINSVEITELYSNQTCKDEKINGKLLNDNEIKSGDAFILAALCPATNSGNAFEVGIKIDYGATMGGVNNRDREEGTIAGTTQ